MVGAPAVSSPAAADVDTGPDRESAPPVAEGTDGSESREFQGDEPGRRRERTLLDAWREPHWALRLRLRDLMGMGGVSEVERLYDLARRADNQLNDFYRSRAEELTRRLRDLIVEQAPPSAAYGDRPTPRFTPHACAVLATIASSTALPPVSGRAGTAVPKPSDGQSGLDLTINERALLNRFRVMDAEDRAALLRVAQRFADSAAESR